MGLDMNRADRRTHAWNIERVEKKNSKILSLSLYSIQKMIGKGGRDGICIFLAIHLHLV